MEHSLPGEPVTNTRIEDKVRRLTDSATACLLQSHAPCPFWGYCVVMVTKNRTLTYINRHGELP